MYLTPTSSHWACDIEADGLLDEATRIWCCTVINCVTKEKGKFRTKEQFKQWEESHPDAIYVGHNFVSYDAPMLNRFWGARISVSRIVDTFVLSQLYNPSYKAPKGCSKGGHSLEAWGIRLRYPKDDFNDFSRFSEEMMRYCMKDTILAALLFIKLAERMTMVGFTEESCKIEHLAWNIIQNKQKRHGFPFDIQKAELLYASLRQREKELQDEIYKLWPPRLECVASYQRPFKKDGTPSKHYSDCLGKYPEVRLGEDGTTYAAYDYVSFNLGSPPQRTEKLLELGWKPVKFTKKTKKGGGGNPKVDEDSLLAYAEESGNPELTALAKWIVTNGRANMIRTWMNEYNPLTGCIHGSLFLAGTLRYKHSSPNTANIPSVRVREWKDENGEKQKEILYGEAGAWTYEARDLWTVGEDDDFVLVGIDAKGVQLRILAHYLNHPPFTEAILSADPHTANAEMMGLPGRAIAKTITYAIVMGAGDQRIANESKTTLPEAKENKTKFFSMVPGLADLIKRLKAQVSDSGRIELCDGAQVLVPQDYMVIPYLLQGDETRLMRQALIYLYQEIRKNGWEKDVFKCADVHDEWQFRVRKSVVDAFIAVALECFIRAGKHFGYNLPIEGDAQKGLTWAQTH
jgi:DNA polymerase-1